MSGIDEYIQDIPKCPECGRRPEYWTIRVGGGPALWLFSENYRITAHAKYGNSADKDKYGEVRHKYLKDGNFVFSKATCMGNGCRAVLSAEEYPELFRVFYRMFDRLYPDKLVRTD